MIISYDKNLKSVVRSFVAACPFPDLMLFILLWIFSGKPKTKWTTAVDVDLAFCEKDQIYQVKMLNEIEHADLF